MTQNLLGPPLDWADSKEVIERETETALSQAIKMQNKDREEPVGLTRYFELKCDGVPCRVQATFLVEKSKGLSCSAWIEMMSQRKATTGAKGRGCGMEWFSGYNKSWDDLLVRPVEMAASCFYDCLYKACAHLAATDNFIDEKRKIAALKEAEALGASLGLNTAGGSSQRL